MKFDLENIFKDGIEDEWDTYVNKIIKEYNICVDSKTTGLELWCYDEDLAELFNGFGIGVGKVVRFGTKFDFDEDYQPVGINYGDYLETVELHQNSHIYECKVYCAFNGVGADYAFALFDIERKIE